MNERNGEHDKLIVSAILTAPYHHPVVKKEEIPLRNGTHNFFKHKFVQPVEC